MDIPEFDNKPAEKGGDHDLLIVIKTNVEAINRRLDSFVTHDEFLPVKLLVYGAAAVVLTGFAGAIITLVMRR